MNRTGNEQLDRISSFSYFCSTREREREKEERERERSESLVNFSSHTVNDNVYDESGIFDETTQAVT